MAHSNKYKKNQISNILCGWLIIFCRTDSDPFMVLTKSEHKSNLRPFAGVLNCIMLVLHLKVSSAVIEFQFKFTLKTSLICFLVFLSQGAQVHLRVL